MLTLGAKAYAARKKAERRIRRLEKYMDSDLVGARQKQIATEKIKEIKSAIQGTRQYSKTGKRYKSKTKGYIEKQLARLESAIDDTPTLLRSNERSYMATEKQLNMASAKKPSVYTHNEGKLFYRATQDIWQHEGISTHDRNRAILDYFNAPRLEKGLSLLTLADIVEDVLNRNKKIQAGLTASPEEDLTEEQQEALDKLMQGENADGEKGSPPGIGEYIINKIRESFSQLFTRE